MTQRCCNQIEPGSSASMPSGAGSLSAPCSSSIVPCHCRSAPPPQAIRSRKVVSAAVASERAGCKQKSPGPGRQAAERAGSRCAEAGKCSATPLRAMDYATASDVLVRSSSPLQRKNLYCGTRNWQCPAPHRAAHGTAEGNIPERIPSDPAARSSPMRSRAARPREGRRIIERRSTALHAGYSPRLGRLLRLRPIGRCGHPR